ncbi:MAG TPA: carbohydrate kinase family protein [Candidatus Saccharimonadia bacterium]|jgi:adenosine kinase|nr:carbohydrate kinase family protein [Candidatus Saccharimonadia bacterium]
MAARTPIIISGSIAIDRIMSFSGRYVDYIHPENLDSLSVSIFLDKYTTTYGGVGANIAYSLAMLGESPILLGSVGPDGADYMTRLAEQGVNVRYVHPSLLPTATFNVITDASENQVGGFYPGAMSDSSSLSFESWKAKNPIVVVSPHDPAAMRRQVKQAKRWKLRLLYDVGQQVSNLPSEDLVAGIEAAEVLIVNEYEMMALAEKTGRSVAAIKALVPVVITTLSRDGSVIEGTVVGSPMNVGVVKPQRVADPTGAGDAYRAGFLYGYARGWELLPCAQLGAACATYAIEHPGTQGHVFTLEAVAERYAKAFGAPPPGLTA